MELLEVRDNFPAVDLERFFLFAAHQINVELRNSRGFQLAELSDVVCSRTHKAKPVDNLIGNELGITAADFGVMQVVVSFPVPNVAGQFRRQLLGLVSGYQIHNVIRNQRREFRH